MKLFPVAWYILMFGAAALYGQVAFRKSLWSFNEAKPWAKRAAGFLAVGIISIYAVSYFK